MALTALDQLGADAAEKTRGVSATALSGKGGTGKSFLQYHLAGQASAEGIDTLVMDADPEQNLTNIYAKQDPEIANAPGLADVLIAAGVLNGSDNYDIEAGAAKLLEVIRPLGPDWPHVWFVPAGRGLQGLSQMPFSGDAWAWLLRDIMEAAGIYHRFRLILGDTAGRRGALVTMVMYASDVAYAPIASTEAAVTKAQEARGRVQAIQEAHPLKWAGVIVTGLDLRAAINQVLKADAAEAFGAKLDDKGINFVEWGQIIADIPYRPATVHQSYQLGERLITYAGPQARDLAGMFSNILHNHILTAVPTEVTA
ncbi:hypothetical protein GCM10012275_63760 [Longimycelium tulufanense]|uniref:CobQ/CobB/MinD/ParA nucleotide binding domain-containing protein n=1 Tax=Longimycelium tulufanense TaxID=907463 RepID=A0A8J3CJ59_9PSEU|nr:ParA family protein [Longimycelium tulufanense]GGM84341.1 hypothetical protein GCM10012275_63760 [Longimycelium tulufanense]